MAQCVYCEIDGLKWEEGFHRWTLLEQEGHKHVCDRVLVLQIEKRKADENARAIEKDREKRGYL